MQVRKGLENIAGKIKNNWKKSLAIVLATGMIGMASKDNVHIGSVTLNNIQKNQYVVGLGLNNKIIGKKMNGSVYSLGLLWSNNEVVGDLKGNVYSYALAVGINEIYAGNMQGNLCCGGVIGSNNVLNDSASINGHLSSIGVFIASNSLSKYTSIQGNSDSRALMAGGPRNNLNFLVNHEEGMNYTKE